MSLTPFEIGRADRQLRVNLPDDFHQTGLYCFVLGSDEAGWFDELRDGDHIGVYRTDLDMTGIRFLRARLRVRGPAANPPGGYEWRLSILVNDVQKMLRSILPTRAYDTEDIGVNVSKLTGTHKVEFRLTFVRVI
jgi:hypothetical protein